MADKTDERVSHRRPSQLDASDRFLDRDAPFFDYLVEVQLDDLDGLARAAMLTAPRS